MAQIPNPFLITLSHLRSRRFPTIKTPQIPPRFTLNPQLTHHILRRESHCSKGRSHNRRSRTFSRSRIAIEGR
ncbi:hypothetical protein AKJ16_DCAP16151 [Drosera capensis]